MGERRSPNTERAYRSDWADFSRWCEEHAVVRLPAAPEAVVSYVTELGRTRRPSTVHRRLAAIADAHRRAGHQSPSSDVSVQVALARVERDQRGSEARTVPLGVAELKAILRVLPLSLAGARDRALILLAYGAALRRSEVVALDVEDVVIGRGGLHIRTRRGVVEIPHGSSPETCAVEAWRAWTCASGLTSGPAFRPVDRAGRLGSTRLSDKSVALVVKRAAARAGLDPSRYAGQSLRRGMVAAAAARHVGPDAVMAHTGHRSRRLVREYLRGEATSA